MYPFRYFRLSKMIKYITILALFCAVIDVCVGGSLDNLPPEVKQMIKNLHDTCVAETGASESDIADFNKGKHNPVESFKCYTKCLLVSLGVMDDDGAFDAESYIDLLPAHMTEFGKKTVATCKIEGNGGCDIAFNFNVCAYKVDPSIYELF